VRRLRRWRSFLRQACCADGCWLFGEDISPERTSEAWRANGDDGVGNLWRTMDVRTR
jgi:hypothetical protein